MLKTEKKEITVGLLSPKGNSFGNTKLDRPGEWEVPEIVGGESGEKMSWGTKREEIHSRGKVGLRRTHGLLRRQGHDASCAWRSLSAQGKTEAGKKTKRPTLRS